MNPTLAFILGVVLGLLALPVSAVMAWLVVALTWLVADLIKVRSRGPQ